MLEGLGETGCVERVMTFHSSWLNTHGLPKPFVGFLLMIGYDRISSKPTGDVRLLFSCGPSMIPGRRTAFEISGTPNRQEVLSRGIIID